MPKTLFVICLNAFELTGAGSEFWQRKPMPAVARHWVSIIFFFKSINNIFIFVNGGIKL